ncbi:MAG: methylated-DNA--[protein]-cysteine S-methyltransferase [Nevskia sp.]|nr:methylated-DNA--[protein]-cysteine S-methyltransferase [Nevskia sp.]
MTATRYFSTIPSPVGELLLLSDGDSLTGLYMQQQAHWEGMQPHWRRDDARLRRARAQLRAYFADELKTFELPIRLQGTEFQERVWNELLNIPFGETVSYGELARRLGQPNASRAVGLANGRNPISIIVPCHRVVGSNGQLTGYGGGLPRKRWLLDHERGVPRAWLALGMVEAPGEGY